LIFFTTVIVFSSTKRGPPKSIAGPETFSALGRFTSLSFFLILPPFVKSSVQFKIFLTFISLAEFFSFYFLDELFR